MLAVKKGQSVRSSSIQPPRWWLWLCRRHCHWLLIVVLLMVASRVGGQPANDVADLKLAKYICANNKTPIESTTQMLSVLAVVQSKPDICKQRYISSMVELDPILKTPSAQLCTEAAFERMKNYHFRFIQPLKHVNRLPTQFEAVPKNIVKQQLHPEPRKYTAEFDENNQVIMVPIAMRHFFLSYALQVSHLCKRNLLNNLRKDADELLNDDDRSIMLLFDRDTPVGQALVSGFSELNFDNVLYIKELDGVANKPDGDFFEGEKKQHLHTSTSQDSSVYAMAVTCKNKFKPIYDKLILPVVRLSKLGYDYQGQELNSTEQRRLNSSQMQIWLGIVHVCELFENSILIDGDDARERNLIPADQLQCSKSEDQDGQLVEVDEEEAQLLANKAKRFNIGQPIQYEVSQLAVMQDRLMITSESQLDLELSLKAGHKNPFGVRGFLRRLGKSLKKGLAKMDLERFAHYRRNSLWYAGVLNFISALSNIASTSITITSACGALG